MMFGNPVPGYASIMTSVLFLGGIFFCFYAVLPTVLDFLLAFNSRMESGVTPTPVRACSSWFL